MEGCDFNRVQPDEALTFYRSMRKEKLQVLNQLTIEQFSSFEELENIHDQLQHPYEDGGHEFEAMSKKEGQGQKEGEEGENDDMDDEDDDEEDE